MTELSENPPAPWRSLKRLLPVGLLLCFLLLSFLPTSASRFFAWPWYLFWQLLLALPPLALAALALLGRRPLPRFGGLIDPGLILGLSLFVYSAELSPQRWAGLPLLSLPLALVSLAYLLLVWTEERCGAAGERQGGDRLEAWAAGCALAGTAVALIPWLWHEVPRWLAGASGLSGLARNDHPFGHSLYTAGAALIFGHLMLLRALRHDSGEQQVQRLRPLWYLGAAAACILLFTTKSRGAVLGLLAGGAMVLPLWWYLRRPPLLRTLAFCGAALLLALCAMLFDPRLSALARSGQWSDSARESNQQRQAMLVAGLQMGRERPLFGQGPGSVPLLTPRFQQGLPGAAPGVLELHSTPLQVWAELGLAGALPLLLLLVGTAAALGRLMASARGQARPARALVLLSLFTGYCVFACTDFQLDLPLCSALLLSVLVLLVREPGVSQATPSQAGLRLGRLCGLGLLLLVGISLHSQYGETRARASFAGAAEAAERGDGAAFVAGTRRAMELAPENPYYINQLAAFNARQPAAAAEGQGMELTRELLSRSLLINRDQEYARYNLGWLLILRAPSLAEEHLRACARMMPAKGRVYLGLSLALHAAGRDRDAADALALELLNHPAVVSLPLWEEPSLGPLLAEAARRCSALRLELCSLPLTSPALRTRLERDAVVQAWWLEGSGDLPMGAGLDPGTRAKWATAMEAARRVPGVPRSLALLRGLAEPGSLPPDAALDAALDSLAARNPGSLRDLLRASVSEFPILQVLGRNSRPGYNVLMRNQDGFPLVDMEILAERRLPMLCLPWLFSPKGGIPSPFLLEKLDAIPGQGRQPAAAAAGTGKSLLQQD